MIQRLPDPKSRWVWRIEDERARALIQVVRVQWNGDEWWVTTRDLPEGPTPLFGDLTDPEEHLNELDRFWEEVTPVGGRIVDLSSEIDDEQYRRKHIA